MEDEQAQSVEGEDAEEVVEGVLVLAAPRRLEPLREGLRPLRQVAAVAATGFVAGAATAAVLGRRCRACRHVAPRAPRRRAHPRCCARGPSRSSASRRYIVDVHTIVQR